MELQTLDCRLEIASGVKWRSALRCSSVFTGWLQGPSQGSSPRTSHICRSGWTQERSWLPKTPAGPAGKGRGEALVKPRTLILECKFIPAAVYWQKEGKSLLPLRIISVLPCQSFARGGSAWKMLSLGQLGCVCPAQKPHLCFRGVLFVSEVSWGSWGL